MATVSMYKSGATHYSRTNAKVPYVAEWDIDLADVATEKGSAIAASDVIEALYVPAGTYVHAAGFQVVEEMTGTSTDAALDMGITGGDVDKFVDGFDLDAAAVGAYTTPAAGTATTTDALFKTADTIDILVVAQTGTITGGKLRVWAIMTSVEEVPSPGRALLGS